MHILYNTIILTPIIQLLVTLTALLGDVLAHQPHGDLVYHYDYDYDYHICIYTYIYIYIFM